MNSKMKKRMIAVAGIIAIVVVALFAVVGAGAGAQVASVSDVANGKYADKKIEVSGIVADNSYAVDQQGVLTFQIKGDDDAVLLNVRYDKGVSSTFGNGVTAICTGRMENGVLNCSELVTKCPSKYESGSSALSVGQLLGYDSNSMIGKTVKVSGSVNALGPVTAEVRFQLRDADAAQLSIVYAAALPDAVADGTNVVVTGALQDDKGTFLATDVALAR